MRDQTGLAPPLAVVDLSLSIHERAHRVCCYTHSLEQSKLPALEVVSTHPLLAAPPFSRLHSQAHTHSELLPCRLGNSARVRPPFPLASQGAVAAGLCTCGLGGLAGDAMPRCPHSVHGRRILKAGVSHVKVRHLRVGGRQGIFAPREDRPLPCSTSATAAGHTPEPEEHRGLRNQMIQHLNNVDPELGTRSRMADLVSFPPLQS